MTLYLHGAGHAHPPNEITNDFLADLDIGTNAEWIMERTGIRCRRTVLSLDYIRETRNGDVRAAREATVCTNAELAKVAGGQAISRAGIAFSDIGMVISGGSVPDCVTPAEACRLAAALDIDAPAFDVRSACTSFGVTLHVLSMMREEALPPHVLIVMPESTTRIVSYRDRSSAVLWGDGCAAMVVSTKERGPAVITGSTLESQPDGSEKVVVNWAGYFEQHGRTVQTFAIKRTVRLLKALQQEFGEAADGRLHFIGHQANALMLEHVCRACEIPPEQHHSNVEDYGNTATAGSISVLSQSWETFAAGDHVAIVGVGAGLTWTGAMVRFEATP